MKRFSRSPVPGPRSPGFTVVELSVVLVVIGLIFVGVLKLEQVYRNYRIRQVVNQYRELSTAVKVYRDRYGYWPGDDPYADVHVGAVNVSAGANAGSDRINQWDVTPNSYEYRYAFEHLARAGLIKGDFIGAASDNIKHVFLGNVWILNNENWYGKSGNSIRFDDLPLDAVLAIETTLDDGNYQTGIVRGNKPYDPMQWPKTAASSAPYNYQAQLAIFIE